MSGEPCQRALTLKRTLVGGGILERGHGAPLERLAQLGNALGGVGAGAAPVKATELVGGQTVMRRMVSMGADTKANTQELVRKGGVLLERLQRQVALEARCNRGSSFGTEQVVLETAGGGVGGGW